MPRADRPLTGLLLLDTTVLIDVLRARPAARRLLALRRTGDLRATSPVNVEAIVRGLRPAEQTTPDVLFAGLHVLPVGREEAELAGGWRRDFAARGVTLHQADCLVAATAVRAGARLATGNPEDFAMQGLHVEHWPVGTEPP